MERLLRQPKRLAVFAYLATRREGSSVARDALTSLFWPEATDARARNALTQALHVIRKELGGEIIVSEGSERVALRPGAVWSDVRAFREMVDAERWADALELYGGELLPGFHVPGTNDFDRWLDEERRELRTHAVRAAWHAAAEAESLGDLDQAIAHVRRGIKLAPYEETGRRYLMALLLASRDTTKAIREYERFRSLLLDELGFEPSSATQEIYEALRAGEVPDELRTPLGVLGLPSRTPSYDSSPDAESSMEDATGRSAVHADDAPGQPSTVGGTSPSLRSGRGSSGSRRGIVTALGVLAIVVSGFLLWPSTPPPSPTPSVLVTAFTNLSTDDEVSLIGRGLAEDIRAELAGVEGVRVLGGGFPAADFDHGDGAVGLGREWDAAYVLSGSVRAQEGQLRVNARLIETSDGEQVWADSFEGRMSDLFELQSAVSQEVARSLGGSLGPRPDVREPAPEAWALYRTGMELKNRREWASAHALLSDAVKADSTYVEAISELAVISLELTALQEIGGVGRRAGAPEDQDLIEPARSLVARAGRLDPDHPSVLYAAARLAEWDGAPYGELARRYRGVVEAGYAGTALRGAVRYAALSGELMEAYRLLARRLGDVPPMSFDQRTLLLWLSYVDSPYVSAAAPSVLSARSSRHAFIDTGNYAWIFLAVGQMSEAEAFADSARAQALRDPDGVGAAAVWISIPGDVALFQQRYHDAARYFEDALRYDSTIAPHSGRRPRDDRNHAWGRSAVISLAVAWAELGETERARALLQREADLDPVDGAREPLSPRDYFVTNGMSGWRRPYRAAAIQAWLGRREVAVQLLEGHLDELWPAAPIIARDPYMEPLRDMPRFQAVVEHLASQAEAIRTTIAPHLPPVR